MNKKKNIQRQLVKIHSEKAAYELAKLKQSFRWRSGNAIARFIEILLFRKREKLSIDFIEEHLATITKLSVEEKDIEEKTKLPTKISHIYFLVSDDDLNNSIFGDTYVANDFASSLKLLFKTTQIKLVKHNEQFIIEPQSALINMLWQTKLPTFTDSYFSIAWIRNYADKWTENTDFLKYDVYLCSSEKIVDFIKPLTDKPVYLFPIAANTDRFKPSKPTTNQIVFVGNKWKEERAIDRFLKTTNHKVATYGKNRENKIIRNADIPKLYGNSKIILDAANETTLKWQSLNSRVFNAIASKRLVLSNSIEATKLFKNRIPVYKIESDLEQQISFYLNNTTNYDEETEELFNELQHHHTFNHRAKELKLILSPKIKIAIKIAASENNKNGFGDWYFAKSLAKNFKYYGHQVRIDCRENWMNLNAANDDLIIVLRGLKAYETIKSQVNFMWLISHPEDVTINEIKQYQHCFIASEFHFEKLQEQNISNISLLHQCSDVNLFYRLNNVVEKKQALLFVGNSRNVYRKSVKYAIELGIPIHVYGSGWKQFIPAKHIKAEFVPNEKLNEIYNSYAIVLNDHWADMLDYGYASNRMFDVAASGAVLLSDQPKQAENLLDGIYYYNNKASFKTTVQQLKNNVDLKNKKSAQQVYNLHSFKKRAQHILHQYYKINEKMA